LDLEVTTSWLEVDLARKIDRINARLLYPSCVLVILKIAYDAVLLASTVCANFLVRITAFISYFEIPGKHRQIADRKTHV
jgi:hypothetical protein